MKPIIPTRTWTQTTCRRCKTWPCRCNLIAAVATLILAAPAYAGGIDEQVFPPDPLPARTYAKMVYAHESGRTVNLGEKPEPGAKPTEPPKPTPPMSKQDAVKSWGVSRWKDAPNAPAFRDKWAAERKAGRDPHKADWSELARRGG
jgi:hypothetical protein